VDPTTRGDYADKVEEFSITDSRERSRTRSGGVARISRSRREALLRLQSSGETVGGAASMENPRNRMDLVGQISFPGLT